MSLRPKPRGRAATKSLNLRERAFVSELNTLQSITSPSFTIPFPSALARVTATAPSGIPTSDSSSDDDESELSDGSLSRRARFRGGE